MVQEHGEFRDGQSQLSLLTGHYYIPKASDMAGDLLSAARLASQYANSRHVDEMCRAFSQ